MHVQAHIYMKEKRKKKHLTAMRSPNWLVNLVLMQLLTKPSIVAPAQKVMKRIIKIKDAQKEMKRIIKIKE